MAFQPGLKAFVLLDNVAGTPVNVSAYADNFSWPQSVDTYDVSVFGSTPKAFISGLTDGDTVAVSGPLDTALGTQLTAVKAAQAAGSSTCTILYAPMGSVAAYPKVSAEAYVSNITFSTGVGGRAEYSASLQVTGAVTTTTW